MKPLQHDRDEDRKEFAEFAKSVNANFVTMQENFNIIQDSFKKLLANGQEIQVEEIPELNPTSRAGSNLPKSPKGKQTLDQSASNKLGERPSTAPTGIFKLQDHHGREMNLDGTPKQPYRHPNFSQHYKPIQACNRSNTPATRRTWYRRGAV